MKHLLYTLIWIFSLQILIVGCEPVEEENKLPSPPAQEEAIFTFTVDEENDNIIHFKNTSTEGFLKSWDFGNGTKAKGSEVIGVFPLKGTYEVTLTVYTTGGSATSSQTIEIAETDPTLLDLPVYNMLTGGGDKPEGKTWVVDASRGAHFGVGPKTEFEPIWYTAGANEKEGGGIYNDTYTFILADFRFEWETEGDVYLNGGQADKFPGASESPVGDYTAPYEAPDNLTWSVSEDDEGNQFLTISNNAFIGYYTGVSTYQILSLTENEMYLRFLDAANPDNAWYLRLIPEGFTPTEPDPEPDPVTTAFPIDFEGAVPPFNGFGGTTYQVVDNPDASGINTSAKVGEYGKGMEGNWAGIETSLDAPLDFSSKTLIKYKVFSPVAGKALFKLETTDKSADPIEVFADVTKVNEWEELTFDFSDAPSGTFDKIAMFLDFDNNNGGTFYIDDIRQEAVPKPVEATDIAVGFEGNNTVTEEQWFLDQVTEYEFPAANPESDAVNSSANVFRYERGTGLYENVQIHLDNKIDLTSRNKFKIKVYFPSTNDYTTTLAKNFAVKLQNRELGGDAWTTQEERKPEVAVMDEWVELTFDFSDVTDRTDFDSIVLQPGGEGHTAPGTFYFDDFELLPAE